MRVWTTLVLSIAVALALGVPSATAGGGNSANAKLCQKGGWQMLVRADGSSFDSQADCVSYAAQGGTLTNGTQGAQAACESFGGTFVTGTLPILWSCVEWRWDADFSLLQERQAALEELCFAAPGLQSFDNSAFTTVLATAICRGSD